MFNACPSCGQYRADKEIDPSGPYAICLECGHRHAFKQLPLFIITGASGTGKSAICLELTKVMKDAVVLDSDILWQEGWNTPENDYRPYRETWLRMCKNISQSGRPVVLCGSAIPSQFEDCAERRYFSQLYYLALVCEDDILVERLKQRPAYRRSDSEGFLKTQIEFNQWFRSNQNQGGVPITRLNTSHDTVNESVEKIIQWVTERLQTNLD